MAGALPSRAKPPRRSRLLLLPEAPQGHPPRRTWYIPRLPRGQRGRQEGLLFLGGQGEGAEPSTPALGGPWDTPAGWQSLCHEATCWAVMTLEPETWFKPQLCTD